MGGVACAKVHFEGLVGVGSLRAEGARFLFSCWTLSSFRPRYSIFKGGFFKRVRRLGVFSNFDIPEQ